MVAGIYITMLNIDETLRKCEKWSFTFDIKKKGKHSDGKIVHLKDWRKYINGQGIAL